MRPWALLALALTACDETPEGPQPDRPIAPRPGEGPPPSHRPNVDPATTLAKPLPAPPESVLDSAPTPKPAAAPAADAGLAPDAYVITLVEGPGYGSGSTHGRLAGTGSTGAGWWYAVHEWRKDVSLRRGPAPDRRVTELWVALDALPWPELADLEMAVSDVGSTALTIARGSQSHTVQMRAFGRVDHPTVKAVGLVASAFRPLPEVKWKTAVAPLPKPSSGASLAGRCYGQLQCGRLDGGGKDLKQCWVGPRAGTVVCADDAWDPAPVTYSVDPKSISPDDLVVRSPWGAVLEGEVRCRRAPDRAGYLRLHCDDGSVIETLIEGKDRWLAIKTSGEPATVKTVLFPGPRQDRRKPR